MYGVRFSHRPSRTFSFAIFVTGIVLAALIGILQHRSTAFTAKIDHFFLDAFLEHSAPESPARNTVVVDIDDVSLSAVGQWPWPRYRMAALIEAIAAARPASIGIDVLFSEPDRSSLVSVQEAFKRDFDVEVAITGAPAELLDNDGYLGHILSQSGAVGSKYFFFDHATGPEALLASGLRVIGSTESLLLNNASGVLSNTPKIAAQTRLSGFINNQPDEDGRIRRVPLLIRHNGVVHANLAVATLMNAIGTASASVDNDASGALLRIGTHAIPIDERGFALLRFNGKPELYPAISAIEVLTGSFDRSLLRGKVVFVGSSAAGLNDLHNTAFDPQFPGLKLQAVMAENIATDQFVREPSWSRTAILATCIMAGLIMAGLFVTASGVSLALLGSVCVVAVLLTMSVLLFQHASMFVSPGAPLLVAGTLFVVFSVTRFALEKRRAYVWFKQVENARQVTIESMAAVAETRDPETGAHIKRTQHYVKAIALQLRKSGQHASLLTQEYIDLLYISAPLHDIGKVGVPDHILLKPGKLTDDEFKLMKQHADYGRTIISSTARSVHGENFLQVASEIASTHHEKWDGTGYPLGLAGKDIPLSGRIMAVADIYDALISRRCYKEPFPHETATRFMREMRATTFDPVVLDAFFAIEDTIKEIAATYKD